MFLNGACATIALDTKDSNKERAAEALADLLCCCLTQPEEWHWSAVASEDFFQAIRQFDLKALHVGAPSDGAGGLPLGCC